MSVLPPFGKVGVFVSARLGSTRLPRKALLPLAEQPMLSFLLKRLEPHQSPATLALLTTTLPEDKELDVLARSLGVRSFCGHPTDLIHRHLHAAEEFGVDWIVRVTADCPFVDASILDDFLTRAAEKGSTATCITTKERYPVGLDFEFFNVAALQRASQANDLNDSHREHLTLYFYEHPEIFETVRISPPRHWPAVPQHFTVDTPEDYPPSEALARRIDARKLTLLQDFVEIVDYSQEQTHD